MEITNSFEEFVTTGVEEVKRPPTGDDCPICMEPYIADFTNTGNSSIASVAEGHSVSTFADTVLHQKVVRVRRCGHIFHQECLLGWITNDPEAEEHRRSCPYCRVLLLKWSPLAIAQAVKIDLEARQAKFTQDQKILMVLYATTRQYHRKLCASECAYWLKKQIESGKPSLVELTKTFKLICEAFYLLWDEDADATFCQRLSEAFTNPVYSSKPDIVDWIEEKFDKSTPVGRKEWEEFEASINDWVEAFLETIDEQTDRVIAISISIVDEAGYDTVGLEDRIRDYWEEYFRLDDDGLDPGVAGVDAPLNPRERVYRWFDLAFIFLNPSRAFHMAL